MTETGDFAQKINE